MVQERRAYPVLAIFLLALASAAVDATPSGKIHAGAGPDQRVDAGAHVVLNGSGRDAEGRPVRFSWAQIAGPHVALSGANRSTARFVAPRVTAETVLKFRLVVTDRHGAKGSSTVTVTLVPKAPAKRSLRPSG